MDNIWGTFKTTKSHLFATYATSTIASIFYHVALMNILIISAKIDIMKKSMQLSPHYYRNHRHATSHIHTGTNQFPPCMDNTLPSWLFPCICYLLKCKFLTQLCPNIMCIEGTSSNRICIEFHPFQHPFANLVIQLIEFKYCNDYLSILTIA